jgi:ATP-binding cassette, subfamily B (MDR/TAP), member 1
MRRRISFVGQEPILFSTTIFENIRYGLPGTENRISTEELNALVVTATRSANAHDFILALPNGYETEVGERGLQLSRGQRQRISIARALIGNPPILLLDEATSALDVKTERAVQRALESASPGRTTVVIAHRLSTIRNADNIIVMSKGRMVEQGQHDDLIARKGFYSSLIEKQHISQTKRAANRYTKDVDTQDNDRDLMFHNEEESMPKIESDSNTSYISDMAKRGNRRASSVHSGDAIGTPRLSLWALANVIRKLTHPERLLIFIGLCCSIIAGLGTPV